MEQLAPKINPQRILWYTFEKKKKNPRLQGIEVDFFSNRDLLTDALASDYYSSIIVEISAEHNHKTDWLEIFKSSKKVAPLTTRILLAEHLDDTELVNALNEGGIYACLFKNDSPDAILYWIQKAHQQYAEHLKRKSLLEGVRAQNRQLENLNVNLENLVLERTNHLQAAHHKTEKAYADLRDLTHFVQELSLLRSIDDLLILIQRETKSFHDLRAPILTYTSLDTKPHLMSVQGKQVFTKNLREMWPISNSIRVNDRMDQSYILSEVGRPINKLITIPLTTKYAGSFLPHLYFEHQLSDLQIDDFLNYFKDRIQPISIALERILLESHLKFTSQQWESTFDGIKDPIAILNSKFEIVRSNRHFSGRSLAHRCYQSFQSVDKICENCPVEKVVQTGQENKATIKRGNRFFEVYSYPIKSNHSSVSMTLINHYVDVTENRELQSRVVQTEKMAAIGFLAGHIAHELNNPLTGIRSLSQILLTEVEESSQIHSDLLEIEKAAGRSQKIIENLLQFAKGNTQGREQNISLNELVRKTLPMLKVSFREHRTEIELSSIESMVSVEPHLMQQVIFNLINNACQAMTDVGTLKVQTNEVEFENKKYVQLVVQDTGEGIPTDKLESIFEPFFTTKKVGEGTGLGLSMSRNIVRQFKGDIFVWSEVGTGSKFTVRLPKVDKL